MIFLDKMAEQRRFLPMTETSRRGLLGDFLAIIALIILALILIWGATHLFSLVRDWVASSRGGTAATGLTVTAPAQARSGERFTVSWKNNTGKEGTYAFVYQCKSGLAFKTAFATGTPQQIPCGVAYRLPASLGTSAALMPVLTSNASTTVPFSILLGTTTTTPTVLAQGNASITIMPGAVAYETIPGGGSTTPRPSDRPVPSGPPDLAVRIVGVGYIDPVTDAFVVGAPNSPAALSAVQFDIINVGSGSTGNWSFSAVLPTGTGYTYRSPVQAPMGPGDHVLNTLRFSGTAVNGGEFTVTASDARDMNTKNDTARVFVPGNAYPAYPYPQYQQQGYQQQYQQQYEYIPYQAY